MNNNDKNTNFSMSEDLELVSYQSWQLTALISAGPGRAADDVKHLQLEL